MSSWLSIQALSDVILIRHLDIQLCHNLDQALSDVILIRCSVISWSGIQELSAVILIRHPGTWWCHLDQALMDVLIRHPGTKWYLDQASRHSLLCCLKQYHSYTLYFTDSACCYNYISIWPYYIVIHLSH